MTQYFPHVNLEALLKFAVSAALYEHAHRTRSSVKNTSGAGRPATGGREGKASVRNKNIVPKVTGCEDVTWAGEKMIEISFDVSSLPLGPYHILAQFPKGRPRLATKNIVAMSMTLLQSGRRFSVPKIYAYRDTCDEIGSEVVLFEKIPGESMDKIWPLLSESQRMSCVTKAAEISLKLFSMRVPWIFSVSGETIFENLVLLSEPFNQGPLIQMKPQPGVKSTQEYLESLADRIEMVFASGNEDVKAKARHDGFPDDPLLTDLDIENIRGTWKRLATLIPYHTGGFFIPKDLSAGAYQVAQSVMQSSQYSLVHTDMRMCRYIVRMGPRIQKGLHGAFSTVLDGELEVKELVLTGWEHAHYAPLWSCARLPDFLTQALYPRHLISRDDQQACRRLFLMWIADKRWLFRSGSWQWVVAYVFGRVERWFDNCLSAHWVYRDFIEVCLTKYEKYWEACRPDVPFPLSVHRACRDPGDLIDDVSESKETSAGETKS